MPGFPRRADEGKVNCPIGAREAGLGHISPYGINREKSDTRHCEPVTDVTGVAIRTPSDQGSMSERATASGGRIATTVCALSRNDGDGTSIVRIRPGETAEVQASPPG